MYDPPEPKDRKRARRFTREAMALARCRDDAALEAGTRAAQAYLGGTLEAELERDEEEAFPRLVRLGLAREVEEAMHQHAVLRGLRYKLMRASTGDPEGTRAVLAEIAVWLRRCLSYEANLLRKAGGRELRG